MENLESYWPENFGKLHNHGHGNAYVYYELGIKSRDNEGFLEVDVE